MTTQATVLGLPNERFFPLAGTDPLRDEVIGAVLRRRKVLGLAPDAPAPLNLLAVSGGGEDGAFGAGVLCGWTESGTRPTFDLVTGVSTGALTAPFAFLGSGYDPQLRRVYTDIGPSDVLEQRGLLAGALFQDALADNTPLFHTMSRYVTARMLADIAASYRQGRLLLIGTTDLDAQLPVVWNVGAIAASGHPRALDVIRRLLLASAAVPGAFPPTMFDVTVNGAHYQEMHVDGGAVAQVFLYPRAVSAVRRDRIKRGLPVAPANAYVIRNDRLDANWSDVQRRTLGIAGRAIGTMIHVSGLNDVLRIYYTTQADDVAYHLAFIGADFTMKLPHPFDTEYMRALFDYGYRRAVHGDVWADRPPFA